jgi:hypothetical protein
MAAETCLCPHPLNRTLVGLGLPDRGGACGPELAVPQVAGGLPGLIDSHVHLRERPATTTFTRA